MSSFLTESSWNIVKLGLNLIPILTTIYLKTSVTERGRDRPHSCYRCGSNSDESAGQGWYLRCDVFAAHRHTLAVIHVYLAVKRFWNWLLDSDQRAHRCGFLWTDSPECQRRRLGSNWGLGRHLQKVCRRTLHGQKRRFLEIICEKKSSTTMTQIFYYFIFRRFQEVFGRYLWNGPSTLKIEENKLHFFRFWV